MRRCLLLGLLLLAACAPFRARTETVSAEDVQAQVATSVALTLDAYSTETAGRATPTPTVTLTPVPSLTPFPTLTPFTPPPTQPLGGGGPAAVEYGCAVTAKVPYDNTVFRPNTDFDVKFWLKNVGTKTWAAGADLFFDGGTDMLTTDVRYELPEVKPGQQVGPFLFDARSPKKAGTFVMNFKTQGGFCYPYVRIVVKR